MNPDGDVKTAAEVPVPGLALFERSEDGQFTFPSDVISANAISQR